MAKNHNFYVVKVYKDMDELLAVAIEIEKIMGEFNEIPFQRRRKRKKVFKKKHLLNDNYMY
jgi:hypothetical protein